MAITEPVGRRGPLPGHGGAPRRRFNTTEIRLIYELARVGATRFEVSIALGVSEDTLARRLSDTPAVQNAYFRGLAALRVAIRRRQISIAMNDSHPKQAKMLIHLGKVILGQTDRLGPRIGSVADALAALTRLFPDVPRSSWGDLFNVQTN